MPPARLNTEEYFKYPEKAQPQELVYGYVREAPAPAPGHQSVVGEMFAALREHVRARALGRVWLSPIDVVLDPGRDLVVQPDIIFVAEARLSLVQDRVRGAPDLAVEVLSPHPRIGTLTERLGWFAEYGVRECWLVRQADIEIEVITFESGKEKTRRLCRSHDRIESNVLPDFDLSVASLLLPY